MSICLECRNISIASHCNTRHHRASIEFAQIMVQNIPPSMSYVEEEERKKTIGKTSLARMRPKKFKCVDYGHQREWKWIGQHLSLTILRNPSFVASLQELTLSLHHDHSFPIEKITATILPLGSTLTTLRLYFGNYGEYARNRTDESRQFGESMTNFTKLTTLAIDVLDLSDGHSMPISITDLSVGGGRYDSGCNTWSEDKISSADWENLSRMPLRKLSLYVSEKSVEQSGHAGQAHTKTKVDRATYVRLTTNLANHLADHLTKLEELECMDITLNEQCNKFASLHTFSVHRTSPRSLQNLVSKNGNDLTSLSILSTRRRGVVGEGFCRFTNVVDFYFLQSCTRLEELKIMGCGLDAYVLSLAFSLTLRSTSSRQTLTTLIVQHSGHIVDRVDSNQQHQMILDEFGSLTNLTTLSISSNKDLQVPHSTTPKPPLSSSSATKVLTFKSKLPLLTSLDLSFIDEKQNCQLGLSELMLACPQLTTFVIPHFLENQELVLLSSLGVSPQLIEVDLRRLTSVRVSMMKTIIENCPRLQRLIIPTFCTKLAWPKQLIDLTRARTIVVCSSDVLPHSNFLNSQMTSEFIDDLEK